MFIIHLILLILAQSSFLWLDWKLVLLFTLIIQLQFLIFGNCILSKKHLEKEDESFVLEILVLLGIFQKEIHYNNVARITVRRIVPLLVAVLAFLLQEYFQVVHPLIQI